MEFSLGGREFIELNKMLKYLNIAESGGMANKMVSDSLFTLNGAAETRRRCKLKVGDVVVSEELSVSIKVVE